MCFSRYLCKCVIIDVQNVYALEMGILYLWRLALMCVYVQGKATLL